jgi:hypothetical protein
MPLVFARNNDIVTTAHLWTARGHADRLSRYLRRTSVRSCSRPLNPTSSFNCVVAEESRHRSEPAGGPGPTGRAAGLLGITRLVLGIRDTAAIARMMQRVYERISALTKEELTVWALANGWRVIAGHPSLTKPGAPNDPIVRLVLKATVVNLEVRKPAGKWEKVAGESYARVVQGSEDELPRGLGFEHVPTITLLMQQNRDAMVFGRMRGS